MVEWEIKSVEENIRIYELTTLERIDGKDITHSLSCKFSKNPGDFWVYAPNSLPSNGMVVLTECETRAILGILRSLNHPVVEKKIIRKKEPVKKVVKRFKKLTPGPVTTPVKAEVEKVN